MPTPPPDYKQVEYIYRDSLGDGWQDWSWSARRTLDAKEQVYRGTHAISATLESWGALSFSHPAIQLGSYNWLEFYVSGDPARETNLWVFFSSAEKTNSSKRRVDDCRFIQDGTIDSGVWNLVRIPLSDLITSDQPINQLSIQDRSDRASNSLWIDEIRLLKPESFP